MSALDKLTEEEREKLTETDMPEWTAPMLATLTDDRFSDPGWIFERKLDGERALTFRDGGGIRLMTRNRKSINDTYPELVEALEKAAPEGCILDGEIVAFRGARTSFSRLQERMQIKDPEEARASRVAVYYYLFDIIWLDGRKLDRLPLRARKKVLRAALDWDDPVRFTPHRNEEGEKFLDDACERGWEGLIAKKADSPYRHDRSRNWLKLKCSNRQEFVIGGFTEPEGSRKGFGALLVGYYEEGDLRYAGKVGTGYDDDLLVDLREELDGIERKTSPFAGEVKESSPHWVTPKLVAEIGFTEWTDDGKLRHPRFLGLREDKDPEDVHREVPR